MSDTTPPVPSVTDGTGGATGGLPNLSAAQVSAMREAWASYGLDADRFALAEAQARHAAEASTQPSVSSVTPSATPGETGRVQVVGGAKAPPITSDQAQQMADALLKAGVDPERIHAAIKADAGLGLVEDTRSDAERDHDASWGYDRMYEPRDYNEINYRDYAPDMDPAKLAAAHQSATEWLAAMQAFPLEGKFLIERAMQVGRETGDLSAAERQTWVAKQRFDMEARFGADGMKEQIRLAALALSMAGKSHPFYQEFRKSDAMHDPSVVRTLANVGRRIEQWRKGGPK